MDQTKYLSGLILSTWIKLSTGDYNSVKSSEQTSTYVPINNTSCTAEASDEDLWQNHAAMFLFKYVAPVLIIVGTVGNLIAVITLQSRLFKFSSTSFLLSMLALCDVLVLNTDLMRWWLICAFHIDMKTLSRYGCKMHYVFAYFSRQMASCALVLLTNERTISVQFPLRCRDICSKERIIPAWIAIAVILFSQVNLNKLQRIQNSLARVITNTSKYQHITPILKKLHWLPIKQRIDYKLCLLTYKTLTNQQPTYLYNSLSFPSHSVSTRSSDSLVLSIPYVRSSLGKRAFSVIGPRLWNSLPPDTRNSSSLPIFRSRLKTHLFKIAFPP